MTIHNDARYIVVIEDDDALARLVERALLRSGYQVEVAHNGLEGLVMIDKAPRKPDLIICDLNMPELDGMELVRALKANQQTRRIAVIFTTARSDTKTMAEGISLGARAYLTKPFTIEDLLSKVKRAIGE